MSRSTHSTSILWLEDSESDVWIFSRKLKQAGFDAEIHHVETAAQFTEAIDKGSYDLILSDYDLPSFSPMEALVLIRERELDVPFLIVSGVIAVDNAVSLMRAGAKDFISKEQFARLVPAIRRELADKLVRDDRRTTRKNLEERNQQLAETLQQLRDAQSHAMRLHRIRAIGEMATGVAHDFNNALMKISGLLASVRCDLGRDVPLDDHEGNLDALNTAVADSKAIMKRVAKFYDTQNDLEPEEVALNTLAQEVAAGIDWTCEASDASIEVIWDLGTICPVLSKDSDLRDALKNVFHNAIDAMPRGGKLTVTTEESPDDRVLLTISDTGEGMSDDELRRCLEPFYSTKGEFGTGLGLGITDAVIQQYGGILSVDSQKGLGTIISIVFKESPDSKPQEPEVKTAETNRNLHILVAEDEVMVATILKRFLERNGHDVDITNTAEEALERFQGNHYDVVLSDRSMPGMSGDELAASIKGIVPTVPFIMVTGFGDLMNSRGERPKGVDLVLPKPVDDQDLNDAVQLVYGSAQSLAR